MSSLGDTSHTHVPPKKTWLFWTLVSIVMMGLSLLGFLVHFWG